MTNPPPPGNWGPPQPPYGQGQSPYASGPWPPQQGWGTPPQTPKNNSLKWLLIGVAVLLAIAISVGATLLFTRDGGDGTTQTANGNPPAAGEIASANDTGPVSIITEDPTCEPWRPIIDTLAKQERQGWERRDYSQPAATWTATQRAMHDTVAEAMRQAADQTVALAKLTPHRVMRELYEQSIAYWRAYADSIPTYTEKDNSLAVVARNSTGALVSICGAIEHGSAAARAHLAASNGDYPPLSSPPLSSDLPPVFLNSPAGEPCRKWKGAADRFDSNIAAWQTIDPNVPAADWTEEQRAVVEAASAVMLQFADQIESIGQASGNSTFADFAGLSAQYWRAFAKSTSSFVPTDSYLSATAAYSEFLVRNACVFAES